MQNTIELDGPVLDEETVGMLREMPGEGGTLLTELVDLYRRDTPERLDRIERAARENDAVGLAEEAHVVKGSSANVGAARLSAMCAELVRRGRQAELGDDVADVVRRLREEYQLVGAALERALEAS